MIGPGANLMPIPAAFSGALNVGYASGADLEFLFAERGSLVAAAGNALISCVRSGNTATCFNRAGQLEVAPQHTPRLNFDPTTLRYENMLTYAREFDNAAWTKSGATISPNAWISPDGLLVAEKLVENSANTSHECHQGATTASGAAHTFQVKVRAAERTQCYLEIYGAATIYRAVFSLTTGALVAQTGSGSYVAGVDKGDGWWLFSITATSTGTTTYGFVGTASGGSSSYLGDGSSGIYILDAQLNTGSTALAFANTLATAKAKEYACKGLLVEEGRTNIILRSEEADNGSWGNTDITVTANAAVAPDGTTSADLLTEGSAGTSLHNQTITISAGSTYSFSCFVKKSGAGAPQWVKMILTTSGGTTRAWFDLTNGVKGTLGPTAGTHTVIGSAMQDCGSGWYRLQMTATITTDVSVLASICSATADNNNSRLASATYLVWGAQLEVGAFATSYIPTTSAAVTRNADVVTVGGVSQWFNTTEGTFTADFDSSVPSSDTTFRVVCGFSSGAFANSIYFGKNVSGTSITGTAVSGGVSQALLSSGTVLPNVESSAALAYKTNDFAFSGNAATVATDGSGTVPPSQDRMYLGDAPWGSGLNTLNGHIKRFAYFRTREANAYLQALTT